MKQIAMLLLIALTTSCGSSETTYRPVVYGHDYVAMEIIRPITFERVSCGDPDFNKYVSVSIDDLVKLATVLKNAKLPRHIRIIVEQYTSDLKELEANGLAPSY